MRRKTPIGGSAAWIAARSEVDTLATDPRRLQLAHAEPVAVAVDPEVPEDEPPDIADSPLVAQRLDPRLEAAEQQRAERVAGVKRPVRAARAVRHPAPVRELI